MKEEIKKKWLEALRSSKYKQGQNRLKNKDNTYCCLGVLCDLHSKETNTLWKEEIDRNLYLDSSAYLPKAVSEWAGITQMGKLKNPVLKGGIIIMNDVALLNDHGLSFEEIADVIQEQF